MQRANYQPSVLRNLHRNDIDVIAVKANCTFIGYEDSSYNGAQIKLPSKPYDRSQFLSKLLNVSSWSLLHHSLLTSTLHVRFYDVQPYITTRWVVFADYPQFKHMDEDIESLKCFCDGSNPNNSEE